MADPKSPLGTENFPNDEETTWSIPEEEPSGQDLLKREWNEEETELPGEQELGMGSGA